MEWQSILWITWRRGPKICENWGFTRPNIQNTRGHGCKFRVPALCVDAFNYSFFPTTIRIWNQLPAAVVMSTSIETFKSWLMGIPATQDFNLESFVLFLSHTQHVFICLLNLDLSFASCTSCTPAMQDITQLWGMCIIRKEEEEENDFLLQTCIFLCHMT